MIAASSVTHGFLTNVIDDLIAEDKEKEKERWVKERALEKLQEVGKDIVTTKCFQDYFRRRCHR
jgi:hypothetical protein